MDYDDFTIWFEPGQIGRYGTVARLSSGAVARGTFEVPVEYGDLNPLLRSLGTEVRGCSESAPPSEAVRRILPMAEGTEASPENFGALLFNSLFSGPVRDLFTESVGSLRDSQQRGLRIKLSFDLDHKGLIQLSSLPWEFLYWQQRREFLCLSELTPVVRQLAVDRPARNSQLVPPLRILVAIGQSERRPLGLEAERREIERSWGGDPRVKVRFLDPVTPKGLARALSEESFHVLHFMGHGEFSQQTGIGSLYLNSPQGGRGETPVQGWYLANLLRKQTDLKLVFLNACETARATSREELDPFAGAATALVKAGVPAVQAMQFPISDRAAIAFTESYYRQIVSGKSLSAAMTEGRNAILAEDPGSKEWGTPVLFERTGLGPALVSAGARSPQRNRRARNLGESDEADSDAGADLPAREEAYAQARARCLTCSGPAAELLVHAPGPMCAIVRQLQRLRRTTINVLIRGETGTGKGLVARALHAERLNGSGKEPFVHVNLASLPQELAASELFGHVKGAFTGAVERREGRFEEARDGTLFLDEVGDLPLPLQAAVLTAIDEKEFNLIGESKPRKFCGQIVTATHRDLFFMVNSGEFRKDLLFRLKKIEIVLPPLRERREDIHVIAEHLLREIGESAGPGEDPEIEPAAIKAMTCYSWPGNVRELASVLEVGMALGHGRILRLADLPEELRGLTAKEPGRIYLQQPDPPLQPMASGGKTSIGNVMDFARSLVKELMRERGTKIGSLRPDIRLLCARHAKDFHRFSGQIETLLREVNRLLRAEHEAGRLGLIVKTSSESETRHRVSTQINSALKASFSEVLDQGEVERHAPAVATVRHSSRRRARWHHDVSKDGILTRKHFVERLRHRPEEMFQASLSNGFGIRTALDVLDQESALRTLDRHAEGAVENGTGAFWCFLIRYCLLGEPDDSRLTLELPGRGEVLRGAQHLQPSKHEHLSVRAGELVAGVRAAITSEMARCPSGSFLMGGVDPDSDQSPVHRVEIDEFWMAPTTVTIEAYCTFLRQTGRENERWLDIERGNDQFPVVYVNWFDACAYARWIGGRLPTEAEWEKAARGGLKQRAFPWGDEEPNRELACFGTMAPNEVGRYPSNGYGLSDMAGNVEEWVQDWYGPEYYALSPLENPQGPPAGTHKVTRGGSYIRTAEQIQCAKRYFFRPERSGPVTGFRCAYSERTEAPSGFSEPLP